VVVNAVDSAGLSRATFLFSYIRGCDPHTLGIFSLALRQMELVVNP
jgi:hypothetical protein